MTNIETEVSSQTNRDFFYNNNQRPVQFVVIQQPPSIQDFIPLLFSLLIYGLIIQTVCLILKKFFKRLYNFLVFLTLLLAPPTIFILTGHYFFPILCLVFFIPMGVIFYRVNKKPLQKDIPKKIFNIFKTLFIVTNFGICIFQTCTIISFYFFQGVLIFSFLSLLGVVYFALLSREIVYFLSETMASNTGFYSKEGVPKRNNNDTLCMICTKVFDGKELVHTLLCKHSFHENCIKGWCMIAKKNSCPYCKKGVDLDSIPKDIWYQSEIWFYPLINTLRSFIVFIVTLIVILTYKVLMTRKSY